MNLRCHVTGIPTPEVEWQKNREPLRATQNGRISFPEENRLRIMFVSTDDTGYFRLEPFILSLCKRSNFTCVYFVICRFFEKHLSVRPPECQTVRIQIRLDILSSLVWVKTVYLGYQHKIRGLQLVSSLIRSYIVFHPICESIHVDIKLITLVYMSRDM